MKPQKLIVTAIICCILALLVGFSISFFKSNDNKASDYIETSASVDSTSNGQTFDYESPVDFEALKKENEDIYAWIDIPQTNVSYPVLQHSSDDDYYLRRGINKKYLHEGVLFTQCSYNSKDFNDPVTIIYGHNINKGSMFGSLQEYYSTKQGIEKYSDIIVYLPDRELKYKVSAVTSYDNKHILYSYDFNDERTFRLFFNEIRSTRTLETSVSDDTYILSGDKALILSTCISGSKDKRFLVCAKLVEVTPNYE